MADTAPQNPAELAKLLQQWKYIVEPTPVTPPKEDAPKKISGVQMEAITRIINSVNSGRQTYDHAMIALTIGFDLDLSEDQARKILGPRPVRPRLVRRPPNVQAAIFILNSHSPVNDWCQIVTRPQSGWFRGQRIIIPDNVAPHFDIVEIRVGYRSQFGQATSPHSAMLYAARVSSGPLLSFTKSRSGEIAVKIDEAAVAECGREFPFETCHVAMDLSFDVRLKDGSPPTIFEAMILGIREL